MTGNQIMIFGILLASSAPVHFPLLIPETKLLRPPEEANTNTSIAVIFRWRDKISGQLTPPPPSFSTCEIDLLCFDAFIYV